jgi:ribosomal protein S18 acetylase RimI-like enzyme
MYKKVILSPELLEQIIYGMENQAEIFCFDVEKLSIIPKNQKETDDPEELRYLSLPRWTPADGYNIMERFVLSLNNPLYRDRLRTILHSGKGVFRNFKDLLKEKPEIEKLWFHYKSRELRSFIQEWLDSFENYRNMMTLGEAKDNLEELILSDFLFLENPPHHKEEVQKLDREVLDKFESNLPPGLKGETSHYRYMNDSSSFLIAESPKQDLAGFMIYLKEHDRIIITNIYTLPEYRGLRVAQELFIKGEELFLSEGFTQIIVESIQTDSVVNHFFQDKEFQPRLITYTKKLTPE